MYLFSVIVSMLYDQVLIPLHYFRDLFLCLSWILQFVGHGVFEKRAPALLTSLFQSLVLGIYFLFVAWCYSWEAFF